MNRPHPLRLIQTQKFKERMRILDAAVQMKEINKYNPIVIISAVIVFTNRDINIHQYISNINPNALNECIKYISQFQFILDTPIPNMNIDNFVQLYDKPTIDYYENLIKSI